MNIGIANFYPLNIFILLSFIFSNLLSQPFVKYPYQLDDKQFAYWITAPDISGQEYGVYYFKKEFFLESNPEEFIINISADNRYKLFINEKYITFGPAAGDLNNWHYEKLDISGFLNEGKNLITTQVWNWGEGKGPRQLSAGTAFILQGEGAIEKIINTDSSWRVIADPSYSPVANSEKSIRQGYIAGVSEKIDGRSHIWSWYKKKSTLTEWKTPKLIGKGASQGLNTWRGLTPWILKERNIPLMEEKIESIPKISFVKGIEFKKNEYSGRLKVRIPKRSKVEILLDNVVLTMGYPAIVISGGMHSKVSIKYQEALFNDDGSKGNRDIWKGKELKGVEDIYLPDGGENRKFEPLWIRIFRYIKITIQTAEDELLISDFHNRFTAYPFEEKAIFKSDNEKLSEIWEVSWRTARLCALETYMDCPYYEQLQYIGDSRIQSLISVFISGDTRLFKNAIEQFYASMQPMGLTKSSHPSAGTQIIPPFSLIFINMLHDYLMICDEPEYIKEYIPGIKFILSWFIKRINDNGMLGPLPYWNHIDGGAEGFSAGAPPGIDNGNSAHMSILLSYTLDRSSEILRFFNSEYESSQLKEISDRLKISTTNLCYDADKGLFAETPKKEIFSQHTNSFAILADLISDSLKKEIGKKLLFDKSLIQTTLYFDFYSFQALKKAGLGGEIINQMNKWSNFIDYGLTTFPEHGAESRSDCHAWAAHPLYDFINITAGIESAEPGFRSVNIFPNPGDLKYFKSSMPHFNGNIIVNYNLKNNDQIFEIILPEGLNGNFIYSTSNQELNPGINRIKIEKGAK